MSLITITFAEQISIISTPNVLIFVEFISQSSSVDSVLARGIVNLLLYLSFISASNGAAPSAGYASLNLIILNFSSEPKANVFKFSISYIDLGMFTFHSKFIFCFSHWFTKAGDSKIVINSLSICALYLWNGFDFVFQNILSGRRSAERSVISWLSVFGSPAKYCNYACSSGMCKYSYPNKNCFILVVSWWMFVGDQLVGSPILAPHSNY